MTSTLFAPSKITGALKAHGGKFYLARRIISLFPANYAGLAYCEPCVYGGSVFLNMRLTTTAHLNDADPRKINVWKAISGPWTDLQDVSRQPAAATLVCMEEPAAFAG